MLHPSRRPSRCEAARRRRASLLLLGAALLVCGVVVGAGSLEAAAPTSQCVACHTDAAKLKALTPPDPPAEEEGEG